MEGFGEGDFVVASGVVGFVGEEEGGSDCCCCCCCCRDCCCICMNWWCCCMAICRICCCCCCCLCCCWLADLLPAAAFASDSCCKDSGALGSEVRENYRLRKREDFLITPPLCFFSFLFPCLCFFLATRSAAVTSCSLPWIAKKRKGKVCSN